MAEVTLYFVMTVLKPDVRPYGRAVELTPEWFNETDVGLRVAVVVPLEHGYIHNAADIITAQLDKEAHIVPIPVLTPEGVKFVTDKLEKPYQVDTTPESFEKPNKKGGDPELENEKFGDDVDEGFGNEPVATISDPNLPDTSPEDFGDLGTGTTKDESEEKFEDSDEQWEGE